MEEETAVDDVDQDAEEQDVYQSSPHLSESEQNEADEIARNSPFVPESREDSASPSSSLSASHPESPRHAVTANPDSPPSYSGLGFPTRRGYEVGNDTASAQSSMDSADESTAFLDASHFVLESDAASASHIELADMAGEPQGRHTPDPPPYHMAVTRINAGEATVTETSFGEEVTTVTQRDIPHGRDEPPPGYRAVAEMSSSNTTPDGHTSVNGSDVEASEGSSHHCGGFLSSLQCCCSRSRTKRYVILASVAAAFSVLCIVLFPIQFSYVSYYQFALVRTKSTGQVATDRVYDHGCYILGADKEFVYLDRTVRTLEFNEIGMFTRDNVDLSIDIKLYYHLNYEDVGQLWQDYAGKHETVIESVALTVIRNCAPRITQDDYLLQREYTENLLKDALDEKFENWGITVSYFNYLNLYLPERVLDKKLKLLLLRTDIEKEHAYQLQREIELETELLTTPVIYAAKEAINNGTVQAAAIKTIAEAGKSQHTDTAHASAFQSMMDKLNITQMDHALSFFYLATLNTMDHYGGVIDYAKQAAFSP